MALQQCFLYATVAVSSTIVVTHVNFISFSCFQYQIHKHKTHSTNYTAELCRHHWCLIISSTRCLYVKYLCLSYNSRWIMAGFTYCVVRYSPMMVIIDLLKVTSIIAALTPVLGQWTTFLRMLKGYTPSPVTPSCDTSPMWSFKWSH